MLEYDGVGYRSGINPFSGLPVSQKKRKVRSCNSTKKGSKTRLATGGTACDDLISCALVDAAAARSASVDTRMAMSVRDSVEAPFDMVTYPSTARRAARPVGSLNVPQPAVVRNAGATPTEA